MVVQHNLIAMNANRMLGLTESTVSGSTEKLSSGYQINRAADNAAGLAISEKMRKQMRGLTQAAVNAEDGISSVQTAEGALSEVQDMLQRMNELCVQAANGTNSSTDRQYIQDEIDQLCTEIDRVAETTKFNDTYLLKGDTNAATIRNYTINYSVTNTKNEVSNAADNAQALEYKVNYTGVNNIYMVSKDIQTMNHNSSISADIVATGNDITSYMKKSGEVQPATEYEYSYKELLYPVSGAGGAANNYYSDAAGTNQITTNWDDYIESDGVNFKVKKGVIIYTGTPGTCSRVYDVTQSDFTTAAAATKQLYADAGKVTLIAAADLKDYFDEDGNYTGGIYIDTTGVGGTANEILVDDIEQYVEKKEKSNLAVSYRKIKPQTVLQGSLTTPNSFYATDARGNSTQITADNYNKYVYINQTGTLAFKAGYDLYQAAPAPGTAYGAQQDAERIANITTLLGKFAIDRNELYQTKNGGVSYTVVAEDDLVDFFDEDGTLTNGSQLFKKDVSTNPASYHEVGADALKQYLKITGYPDADNDDGLNKAGAVLNDEQYVALVAVSLNSDVATGSNGSVDSQRDADSTYDLSTDGVTNTVRANKDMYIYTRATQTITHLSAGDEMTKYLNSDNTMDDKFVLLDILDGENGTSDAVKEQMLGGEDTDFVWTNSYIEMATSMQTLYDKEGKIVSGIRLNEYFDENGNYQGGLYTTSQARIIDQVFAAGATNTTAYQNVTQALGKAAAIIDDYITTSSKSVAGNLDFTLHVGADRDDENKITVSVSALTATGIGIDKIHSDNIGIVDSTGQLATDAVDVVAKALNDISRQRASLGAIQNRLEHTTRNLDNVVENTTAAESQIRDTDMAKEMVKYANANILQQAGQSMLAQANQSNQGVMSLLQ